MPLDLKIRTFTFAVSIGKLIPQLPNTIQNRVYFSQLIKCSSSVGANYRASQRAKSDKDFINKLKIVEEEADESVYFLQLLSELNPSQSEIIKPLIQEGIEILKIIVASINKKKGRSGNQNNS